MLDAARIEGAAQREPNRDDHADHDGRKRAAIIPSVRVSYFGTPQGSIGGQYIPFERLFQDNDVLFGLPTVVCAACATLRTK